MSNGDFIDRCARVLVVEDEPLISDIVTEALAEQGFAVQAVDNARDALAWLRSGSPVDILFTDINLKGTMDGGALAQCARELRPDLPVVYTSGTPLGIRSSAACEKFDVCAQAVRSVRYRLAAATSGDADWRSASISRCGYVDGG